MWPAGRRFQSKGSSQLRGKGGGENASNESGDRPLAFARQSIHALAGRLADTKDLTVVDVLNIENRKVAYGTYVDRIRSDVSS